MYCYERRFQNQLTFISSKPWAEWARPAIVHVSLRAHINLSLCMLRSWSQGANTLIKCEGVHWISKQRDDSLKIMTRTLFIVSDSSVCEAWFFASRAASGDCICDRARSKDGGDSNLLQLLSDRSAWYILDGILNGSAWVGCFRGRKTQVIRIVYVVCMRSHYTRPVKEDWLKISSPSSGILAWYYLPWCFYSHISKRKTKNIEIAKFGAAN